MGNETSVVRKEEGNRLAFELELDELKELEQLIVQQYPWIESVTESMLVTDITLPDQPIVYANDYFERMTLYPREEIIGFNCRFLQGKHSNRHTVKLMRDAIKKGKAQEVEILNYRRNGEPFLNNFVMLPVKGRPANTPEKVGKSSDSLWSSATQDLSPPDRDPSLWKAAEVATFLELANFEDVVQLFVDNNIAGKEFLTIDDKRLKKIGIVSSQLRKRIIQCAQLLAANGRESTLKEMNPTFKFRADNEVSNATSDSEDDSTTFDEYSDGEFLYDGNDTSISGPSTPPSSGSINSISLPSVSLKHHDSSDTIEDMTALGVHEDFDPLQPEELELWCRAAKKSSLEEEKSSQPSNDEVTVKFFNDGSYQVLSFSRGVSLFLLKDKIAQQCGIELDRLEISSMPTPKSETKSVITDQVELNKLFDEWRDKTVTFTVIETDDAQTPKSVDAVEKNLRTASSKKRLGDQGLQYISIAVQPSLWQLRARLFDEFRKSSRVAIESNEDFTTLPGDCLVVPTVADGSSEHSIVYASLVSFYGQRLQEKVESIVISDFYGEMQAGDCFLLQVSASTPQLSKSDLRPSYLLFICYLRATSGMKSTFGEHHRQSDQCYFLSRKVLAEVMMHNERVQNGEHGNYHQFGVEGKPAAIHEVVLPALAQVNVSSATAGSSNSSRLSEAILDGQSLIVARQMKCAISSARIGRKIKESHQKLQKAGVEDITNVKIEMHKLTSKMCAISGSLHKLKSTSATAKSLENSLSKGYLTVRGVANTTEIEWLTDMVGSTGLFAGNKRLQHLASVAFASLILGKRFNTSDNLRQLLSDSLLQNESALSHVLKLHAGGAIRFFHMVPWVEMKNPKMFDHGSTATVYQAKYQNNNYAVKLFFDTIPMPEILTEVAMLSLLRHPCLIRMEGMTEYEGRPGLVMEFAARGSLFKLLRGKRLRMDVKYRIARDVASGLAFLHRAGIIHRDIKSMNVLIMKDWTSRLCDYGSSRQYSKNMTRHVGTLSWTAPEVMETSTYTEKADVYSFGMLLYEIFAEQTPFETTDQKLLVKQILKGTRPEIPDYTPKEVAKLMSSCWNAKPQKRPSMEQVLDAIQRNIK